MFDSEYRVFGRAVLGLLGLTGCASVTPGGPPGEPPVPTEEAAANQTAATDAHPSTPHPQANRRRIEVTLEVPDGGWSLRIAAVYRTERALFVHAAVDRRPGPAVQAIQTRTAVRTVQAPEDLPIQVVVEGTRWGWTSRPDYRYLPADESFQPPSDAERLALANPTPNR